MREDIADLPAWAWKLAAAVLQHEDTHAEKSPCLYDAAQEIPEHIRAAVLGVRLVPVEILTQIRGGDLAAAVAAKRLSDTVDTILPSSARTETRSADR